MTKVSDVIEKGDVIPDDVTEVDDDNGYVWSHRPTGWWGPRAQSLPGEMLVSRFGPLTVTAVREPEPGSCPAHGLHPHKGATCLDCPACRPPDGHVTRPGIACLEPEITLVPDIEPGPSVLLDLVRQYGDEREAVGGYTPDIGTLQADRANAAVKSAHALFDRIAALVPQQPSAPDFLDAVNKLTIARGAMERHRDELHVELVKTRGEREDARAEVERLKAAQPDPSVLSLPQAQSGSKTGSRVHLATIKLAELRGLLNKPLLDLEPGVAMRTLREAQELLFAELKAPVVMREPRTELPCGHSIAASRFEDSEGDVVLITVAPARDANGDNVTTPLAWCAQGHGWLSLTAEEFAELTEVFEDEAGGEPR